MSSWRLFARLKGVILGGYKSVSVKKKKLNFLKKKLKPCPGVSSKTQVPPPLANNSGMRFQLLHFAASDSGRAGCPSGSSKIAGDGDLPFSGFFVDPPSHFSLLIVVSHHFGQVYSFLCSAHLNWTLNLESEKGKETNDLSSFVIFKKMIEKISQSKNGNRR